MNREYAKTKCKELLSIYGLSDWGVRLTTNNAVVGYCDKANKVIYLNIHHIDTHPDSEILDTMRHEIAHALTPDDKVHGFNWRAKAIELGAKPDAKCSYGLNPAVIDAIRSGMQVDIIETKKIEYKISSKVLTEFCPVCKKNGKDSVAIVKSEKEVNGFKVITYDCNHIVMKQLAENKPYETIVFDGDKNCKHTFTLPVKASHKTICSKCNAKRPYPFQIEGMRAIGKGLSINPGFAVLDSMGLGKTIQALGYIKFLEADELPVLFVVKSGLKYQFASEIMRILGDSYFPLIISGGKQGVLPGLKCYIIGYDTLRNFDTNKFKSLGIKLCILDEVQQIKNPDSTRAAEVRDLMTFIPKVIPLSGTPWKNRGSELFTMFNLLSRTKFPSYQKFLNDWVDYQLDSNGKYKEAGIKNPKKFREYIKDLAIRREPEQVMKEFPPISRYQQLCTIPEVDQDDYNDAMDEFVQWFNDLALEGKNPDSNSIIAKLSRLRHLIGQAKIPFTLEHLEDWSLEGQGKVLVGCHHKDVLDIMYLKLEKFLDEEELTGKIKLMKITSDMDGSARFAVQNLFNSSERAICLASTLAAGEGLNLQTGDYGILHERQWNPANEEQFEGRLRRIGQLKRIKFDYIHAQGSIDEHFHRLVEKKRINFNAVMNHDFENEQDINLPCTICGKDIKAHETAWDGESIMQSLAVSIVEDANKVRKVSTVRNKKRKF